MRFPFHFMVLEEPVSRLGRLIIGGCRAKHKAWRGTILTGLRGSARPWRPGLSDESKPVAKGSPAALWRSQVWCYFGSAGYSPGVNGAAASGSGVSTSA